ncbi:uncharacterized protein LOC144783357 [Lissotriton helveticus]
MTLDATKAFERVNWKHLIAVLEKLNLGPNFCRTICRVYNEPSASLVVNEFTSLCSSHCKYQWRLQRGLRQQHDSFKLVSDRKVTATERAPTARGVSNIDASSSPPFPRTLQPLQYMLFCNQADTAYFHNENRGRSN